MKGRSIFLGKNPSFLFSVFFLLFIRQKRINLRFCAKFVFTHFAFHFFDLNSYFTLVNLFHLNGLLVKRIVIALALLCHTDLT